MKTFTDWLSQAVGVLKSLHPDTLGGALALLALFVLAGLIATGLSRRAIKTVLDRDRDEKIDRLAASFLTKMGSIFIWLLVLTLYAHMVPYLDKLATALLASVSIASVVIGLALQSTLANLVAGVSLIFYKPFRKGDKLQISAPTGVETGIVEDVTLGYTVIQTYDNRRVVMANSQISNTTMINLSSVTPRTMAMVPFSIGYDCDIDEARKIATELAMAHPDVQEIVSCPLVNLGGSSVDFSLRVWCPDSGAAVGVHNDLLEAIKKRFDAEGFEIPYAYQNVILQAGKGKDGEGKEELGAEKGGATDTGRP